MGAPSQQQVSDLYRSGVDAVAAVTANFDDVAWSTTTCGVWTATETVRHLLAVADWYHEWLDRAIAGDAARPFEEHDFEQRNAEGVARHATLDGQSAVEQFRTRSNDYLSRVQNHWDLPYGYPGGTVSAGQHCALAATEWHLHAWDLSGATDTRHEPANADTLMLGAALALAAATGGIQGRVIRAVAPAASRRRPWQRLLRESDRPHAPSP